MSDDDLELLVSGDVWAPEVRAAMERGQAWMAQFERDHPIRAACIRLKLWLMEPLYRAITP